MKILIALAAALVVATSLSSQGQSVGDVLYYDLRGNSGNGATGAAKTFKVNGQTLAASAWSYTKGSSNSAFEASKLGQYSTGLGVTNNEEDGSSPYHQVDNYKQNDYVLFVFDTLVDINSVVIDPAGKYDRDVSYWVGNIDSSNLDGLTYVGTNGLGTVGFESEVIDMSSRSSSARTVDIKSYSQPVNAILFGTESGLDSGDYLDAFKIKSIKATVAVPEPSSALLSALGVFALCFRRKR
ncbi:PEP-CTERM sorting domain-containing protein [Luteolibacter sp. AS25]|uniref:PEP-CTERM sorting domain-containing protein n=1 Tax=Luteolibacter sp. AS25 TaxID=3135776 RepID=UPI00398B8175